MVLSLPLRHKDATQSRPYQSGHEFEHADGLEVRDDYSKTITLRPQR